MVCPIRVNGLKNYLCGFFDNLWTSSIGYTLWQKLGKEKAKIPCVTVVCNEVLNIFIYALAIGKAYAKEISKWYTSIVSSLSYSLLLR